MASHKDVEIVIDDEGNLKMIYDDTVAKSIEEIGDCTVKRASHVEPSEKNNKFWKVDLTPVEGPIIDGFKTRKEALKFEVDYLKKNIFKLRS